MTTQLTGNVSANGATGLDASANFATDWQQILSALKLASRIAGNPGTFPRGDSSERIQQVIMHRDRAHAGLQHIRTALRPDAAAPSAATPSIGALTESRKPATKRPAVDINHTARPVSTMSFSTTDAAPLPAIPQIQPAIPASDAQASALLSPAISIPLPAELSAPATAPLKTVAEVQEINEDGTGSSSHLNIASASAVGLSDNRKSIQETAVAAHSGKASPATKEPADQHIETAEPHLLTEQPVAEQPPATDETPMQQSPLRLESHYPAQPAPLAATPAVASRPALTRDRSTTSDPAHVNSAAPVQQPYLDPRSQQAFPAGTTNPNISRPKPTETAPAKATAGLHFTAKPPEDFYRSHLQDQTVAANPLTTAAIMRSEHASDLAPRDETQPAVPTMHDPFAALDGRAEAPTPTWMQAGAHHAEAGYLDPSLGWIGVRAQANGSALHATIVPGSGEAAQALGSHVASLNSFLTEHHGRSSTVTLATPDQGQQQGALNNSNGRSPQQQTQQQSQRGHASAFASPAATIASTRTSSRTSSDAPVYSREGIHISLIA